MLFNSPEFIFVSLPCVVIVFLLLRSYAKINLAICSIIAGSIIYYAWWSVLYAVLLILWVLINAVIAYLITSTRKKIFLILGICANLAVLAYFKYSLFFVENIGNLLGVQLTIAKIILPIGISFFTFQKIAFLVDAWRGEIKSFNLLHYLFFVTFFPQLIAGPIVHYRELSPQLARLRERAGSHDLAIGISMFAIGLFKKAILADTSASFSDPIFAAAGAGQVADQATVWIGALAYTFQLYFDFSGYSDMAMGCARMFGISLPLNFNSPYKAASIIEFWRRWHITLSRFFRDYLYFPLGGGKLGNLRQHLNLIVVMVLAGFWHGASWNFVFWGALHGLMLTINHLFRGIFSTSGLASGVKVWWTLLGRLLTFACVAFAWIPFRAEKFPTAVQMMAAAAGLGEAVPRVMPNLTVLTWLVLMFAICNLLPNTCELFMKHHGALIEEGTKFNRSETRLSWQPVWWWAAFCAILYVAAALGYSRSSPFIYFQF